MPERTDAEERRELQRKAYGPGGALTAAEEQRLRELQDARLPVPVPSPAPEGESPRGADESDASRIPASREEGDAPAGPTWSDAPSDPSALDATVAPVAPETLRGGLRRNANTLLAAFVVLLAIGVGAGWALFAPRPASLPLTEEQQQRRVELSVDAFDPGSVRAVAQNDVALVWYATRESGEVHCLVLDVGAQSQTDCLPSADRELGLSAALPLPSEDAEDAGGRSSENVAAMIFLTADGEPMVGLQRWGTGLEQIDQFAGAERDRAGSLVAEGYSLGLSIVGRFRGAPVWTADRLSDQGATQRCLIVDGGGGVTCEAYETAVRQGLGVHVVDVDSTGGVTAVSVLELRYTGQQTPYLTVTSGVSLSAVGPGESFVVQGPPGDPIEIRAPDTGSGG